MKNYNIQGKFGRQNYTIFNRLNLYDKETSKFIN